MTPEERIAAAAARYDGPDGEAALLTVQALRRRDWRLRRGGKVCSRCGRTYPLSAFGPRPDLADGLERRCRKCERNRARERRALD